MTQSSQTQSVARHLDTLIRYVLRRFDVDRFERVVVEDLANVWTWVRADGSAIDILKQHGLACVAYDALKGYGFDPIPEDLQNIAKRHVVGHLASQRVYDDIIQSLAERCAGHIVVQKGYWLSRFVYPRDTWRGYADLDLLIEERDLFIADRIIKEHGFNSFYSSLPGREHIPCWVDRTVMDSAEYKKGLFFVDLHLNLIPRQLPNRVSIADVWDNLFAIDSEPYCIVSPIDTVIHFLVHAKYHKHEHGMRTMLDILLVMLMFKPHWSWDSFCSRVEQFDVGYLIKGSLHLYQTFLDNASFKHKVEGVPVDVLKRFEPHAPELAHLKSEFFLNTFILQPNSLAGQERSFMDPILDGGFSKCLKAAVRFAFYSPRRIAARYGLEPDQKKVYYYMIKRPLNLLRRILPMVFKKKAAAH